MSYLRLKMVDANELTPTCRVLQLLKARSCSPALVEAQSALRRNLPETYAVSSKCNLLVQQCRQIPLLVIMSAAQAPPTEHSANRCWLPNQNPRIGTPPLAWQTNMPIALDAAESPRFRIQDKSLTLP
jgi:hypothetical protein